MAAKKAQPLGRPPKAPEQRAAQCQVRLTPPDKEEFQAECDRLALITGQPWTISSYLRMAGHAMKGKHLAKVPTAAEVAAAVASGGRSVSGGRGSD